MITIKDWMELINYRITDGSDYQWNCYGDSSHALDSWNGGYDDSGFSLGIIFDTHTQVVYEVNVCDYGRRRAYRIINPDYKQAHDAEAKTRSVSSCQAWDDVEYVDLDSDEDFLRKARAIFAGEEYDTKVDITVEFTDEELLKYMKLAHQLDITFNQFIERALQNLLGQNEVEHNLST